MKEQGKAHGGGASPPSPLLPGPGHQRRRLPWPSLLVASVLAAWLLLSSRGGGQLGREPVCGRPASAALTAAPLPAALAPLEAVQSSTASGSGSGAGSSDGDGPCNSGSSSGGGDPWSSELRTPAARQLVPELQQQPARAALHHRWGFSAAAINATGAPATAGLRIPRIIHHGGPLCSWARGSA